MATLWLFLSRLLAFFFNLTKRKLLRLRLKIRTNEYNLNGMAINSSNLCLDAGNKVRPTTLYIVANCRLTLLHLCPIYLDTAKQKVEWCHFWLTFFMWSVLTPEWRLGVSDVSPISGISRLSLGSTLLSPLLFFCLVLFLFLSFFLPADPFSGSFFPENSLIFFVKR